MAKAKTVGIANDELTQVISESLNKQYKGEKIAYFLDQPNEAPTDVKDWVPTGCSELDIAISNRPNGGLPVGKIIEITGLEASGKSLICAHVVAETQKKNGIAVYFDTESAMNPIFAETVGVDLSKMIYVQTELLEHVFESIEAIINKIRESNKDKLVTIIVDSVMGSTTEKELDADYAKEGWATDKAIVLSKAMRKITNQIARQNVLLIFTNQLRQKLGVMFGDPWTTSGGKALAFHSSVRLRLKQMGQIKIADQVVGIKTSCQVIKNRVGPPLRKSNFNIFFDRGIDNLGNWLETLKAHGYVSQSGAWYAFKSEYFGELTSVDCVTKFQSKDFFKMLEENSELKNAIYAKICDAMIMKYKSDQYGIDDVEIDSETSPE